MDIEIHIHRQNVVHEADKVLDWATKPISSPHHNEVKLAYGSPLQQLVKCWALVSALGARDGVSMNWQEGVAVTVVLLGLGAGAFLVAQRSSVWNEFGQRLVKALLPLAWRYVSKWMPPADEAA